MTSFTVFQLNRALPETDPKRRLWQFQASRDPVLDLSVSALDQTNKGFVQGRTRWNDVKDNPVGARGADRIGYNTAYFFLQHSDRLFDSDTTHHDFLDAFRFHFQHYGFNNNLLIDDAGMAENPFGLVGSESTGMTPYSYEPGVVNPVDHSRPGGVIDFIHQRRVTQADGSTVLYHQVLQSLTIPAVEAINPATRWYYQLGGLWVGENDDLGIIARLQITALHPAYGYVVRGA